MTDDYDQILYNIKRKQIEEDVRNDSMRIWASQESYMQPIFTRCTNCGERRRCISHVVDLSTECCECYMKRRIRERMELLDMQAPIDPAPPSAMQAKFDLEDFTRL